MAPGCSDDGQTPGSETAGGSTTGEARDDVDGTGDTGRDEAGDGRPDDGGSTGEGHESETGEEEEPIVLDMRPVFGVPNLDDDDEDGRADWLQVPFAEDNDIAQMSISGVPEGHTVEMILDGDLENLRIWGPGGELLGHGSDPFENAASFDLGPDGLNLQVEFGDYNVAGTLDVRLLDQDEVLVDSLILDLHSSPLILNHHLQPTEQVWVVQVTSSGGNASMVGDLEAVLGDRLTKLAGSDYDNDVWIQDEIELATSIGADGTRLDTVIDSIRERRLGRYPKDHLVHPDSVVRMWGSPSNATTFDSFGNLEVSPPVTANGIEYPLGRIYYGREGSRGLDGVLAEQLAAQHVQAPFRLDTNWLCVGHVDEVSTFVPDPAAPKGFRMLFADVPSAYEILDGLDPTIQLPRYAPSRPSGHGIATVGALASNTTLRAYNQDVQALRLDPMLDRFRSELDLDDEDIILIPTLFERRGTCGAIALIPGTVNLLVANIGAITHLFMPDPFLRSDAGDQSSDPFIRDFAARMPQGLELHFVDNWRIYHMANGEVHCGTNARRTPTARWYEAARHLLEKE